MNYQYENLLLETLTEGTHRNDRTGTGTRSLFARQMRFDLSEGFPLITTKKVHFKSIVAELLWMLSGSTNVEDLHRDGVTIWDEWADENGNLGPVYGAQWRSWAGTRYDSRNNRNILVMVDQIQEVIKSIRTNPDSRRHIVSAWNVAELPSMALPPCHLLFQFYVADGKLSCQLYQRSADMFLGVPFNIASYSLLTMLIAQQTGLQPGEFIWTGGDVHVYDNHQDQAWLQLMRTPTPFPTLNIKRHADSIDGYTLDDFELIGYHPHPAIKAPVAV